LSDRAVSRPQKEVYLGGVVHEQRFSRGTSPKKLMTWIKGVKGLKINNAALGQGQVTEEDARDQGRVQRTITPQSDTGGLLLHNPHGQRKKRKELITLNGEKKKQPDES